MEPKGRAQVPGSHKSEEKAARPQACTASYIPLSECVHFCDCLPTQIPHCNSLQPCCVILGRSPYLAELLIFCLQKGYSDIPRTEEEVRVTPAGLVDLGIPSPHGTPELSFHVHSSIFVLIVLVQLPPTQWLYLRLLFQRTKRRGQGRQKKALKTISRPAEDKRK